MKTETIYDAVSGVDEAYISEADDTEAIRRSFRNERSRRIKTVGTICVCAAVVVSSVWIGSRVRSGNKRDPLVTGSGTQVYATSALSDHPDQVARDVSVDHEQAQTYFAHPIASCERSDFNGYSVLLVRSDGDVVEGKTACLSVTYLFENGTVTLYDQDRTGNITTSDELLEYRSRDFYVHTPEFNGDNIRICYFPSEEAESRTWLILKAVRTYRRSWI